MRNLDTCENTSKQLGLSEKIAFLQQYFTPEIRNFLNEANTQIFDLIFNTLVKMQRDVKSIEDQDVFFFYEKNEVYKNFQDTYSHIKAIVVELLSNQSWQSPSFDSTFIEQKGILQKVVVPFMNDYERFLPPVEYATSQLKAHIESFFHTSVYVEILQSGEKINAFMFPEHFIFEKRQENESIEYFVARTIFPKSIRVEVATYEEMCEVLKEIQKAQLEFGFTVEEMCVILNSQDYFEGCVVVSNFTTAKEIMHGYGVYANEKQIFSLALENKLEILSSLEYPKENTYECTISEENKNFLTQQRIQNVKNWSEMLEISLKKLQKNSKNILQEKILDIVYRELVNIQEKIAEIIHQTYFFNALQQKDLHMINTKYKEFLMLEKHLRSLQKWSIFIEGYFENIHNCEYKKEVLKNLQQLKNKEYKSILNMPEHVSLITTSGMASAVIILEFLKKQNTKIIQNNEGYFEVAGVVKRVEWGSEEENEDALSYSDHASLNEILEKENGEKNIAIFIEPISNNQKKFVECNVEKCIECVEKNAQIFKQYYIIIDNTVCGKQFQLADILGSKKLPDNIHVILFKSLQKYDTGNEDMCSGGLITVFGKECDEVSKELSKIQKKSGGIPSADTLSQLKHLHNLDTSVEKKISIENAKWLAERMKNIVRKFPYVLRKVVYHKEDVEKALSPIVYVHLDALSYNKEDDIAYNPNLKNPNSIFRVLKVKKRLEYFWELLFEESKKQGLQIVGGTSFGFKTLRIGKYSPALRICPGIEGRKELEVFCACVENVCEKISKPIVFQDLLKTLEHPNMYVQPTLRDLLLKLQQKNFINGQYIYRCFCYLEILHAIAGNSIFGGLSADEETRQMYYFANIAYIFDELNDPDNHNEEFVDEYSNNIALMAYKMARVCKGIASKITETNYKEIIKFGKSIEDDYQEQIRKDPKHVVTLRAKFYEACMNEIFASCGSYESVKNIISKHIDALLDKIKNSV